MITIRIGDGRTKYGKILDRNTTWYTYGQKEHAIEAAISTGKKIYISENGRAYVEISLEDLRNL